MVKKITKYAKFAVCCALILSLIAPSYAALSASDGSAFVTKAEFDSALADFNARLTTFEAGINSKIDSQVTSYLDRNGIWNGATQVKSTPYNACKNNTAVYLFNWGTWGPDRPPSWNSTYLAPSMNNAFCVGPSIWKGGEHGEGPVNAFENIYKWAPEVKAATNTNTYLRAKKEDEHYRPWLETLYGSTLVSNAYLTPDIDLFTSNKSGLCFLDLSAATINGIQTNAKDFKGHFDGHGECRTMWSLWYPVQAGRNNASLSAMLGNAFAPEAYSFDLDIIDKSARTNPSVAPDSSDAMIARYPWYSGSAMEFDKQPWSASYWYYLYGGEPAPYQAITESQWVSQFGNKDVKPESMLSFNVPNVTTTLSFFVSKDRSYSLRLHALHQSPFNMAFTVVAALLNYSAYSDPCTFIQYDASVY